MRLSVAHLLRILINFLIIAICISAFPSSTKFLFDNDKFVKEIKTNSQLDSLLQHLASIDPPSVSSTAIPHELQQFNLLPNDEIYLIIYYAEWCPHCHHTAPAWKNLANVFHCTEGIRFFAFECSMTSDDRIGSDKIDPLNACANQGVSAYPTAIAYWSKRNRNSTVQIPEAEKKTNNDFSVGERIVTIDPSLSPEIPEVDQVVYNISFNDRMSQKEMVLLRAKVKTPSHSVLDFKYWILTNTLINKIQKCTLSTDTDLPLVEGSSGNSFMTFHHHLLLEPSERWSIREFNMCPDTRLYDSINGLFYLLRNWVIVNSKNGLTQQRNEDLKQLILPLITLLPGRNIQSSLKNFYNALNNQSTFTFTEYHSLVDHLDLAGLKALPSGINPTFLHTSRLTSSMWLLFHTMTISLFVQYHSMDKLSILFDSNQHCNNTKYEELFSQSQRYRTHSKMREVHHVTPWDVARAIRTTVSSFFACEACRVHFITFFDLCYADLCVWVRDSTNPFNDTIVVGTQNAKIHDSMEGLLLWLWRFHNAVTFRTAAERTSSSIVTMQELSIQQNNRKSSNNRLVSYEGQDVRFPPTKLCSSCHLSLPLQFGPGNTSIFNSSNQTDIISNVFKVSPSIVASSVMMERIVRGYETGFEFQLLEDSTWDRIEDFNFKEIKKFLVNYFWKEEWMDFSMDLICNNKSGMFSVVSGTSDHEQPNSRKLYGPPSQMVIPSFQQVTIGTVGRIRALFCFIILSSVIVFVMYMRVKRYSLFLEFYRVIGIRHHLKTNRRPFDIEKGDSESVDINGSARTDRSRQRYLYK